MSEPILEQSIFLHAIELALADRAAYLDEACRDNPKLRAELDALLAAHEKIGIAHPPAIDAGATASFTPPAEASGTVIGPYRLLEQIGEGGMGAVWMAQQSEPVKRLVAVKLIKAGMDSRQVIARFEAERQALALMDHPNIARVLDGGTTATGRPYFVMDLVKGVPITKYCDEHHLTPRQRLELFIPVCQAVQHAHQKGIIHRDLKPSNVLVALYDGRPVPKVIDFGVAKAAGQSLTDKTLVTGFGNIVGTLEYMSPEQAEVNQLDIDTRSDIYSLGVLLYELLAGSPPFSRKELEKAGMLEMLRVIREQEPSKPSTKLSTAEGLPTLAANRGTEPAKLTKLVRGELDWIVMKALEKDRNRRYETANGFAMDVQRYLADEQVLACPPSVGYRLRKFVRRNRTALVTIGIVLLALVAGTGISVWQAIRATEARQQAQDNETAANDEKRKALAAAAAEKKATEAEATQRGRAEENLRLALRALDDVYLKRVKISHGDRALSPADEDLLKNGLAFYEAFAKQNRNEKAVREETAKAYYRVADLRTHFGESAKARQAYREAITLWEALATEFPDNPLYRSELEKAVTGLAIVADGAEAEAAARQALAIRDTLPKDYPSAVIALERVIVNYYRLTIALDQLGRGHEAEASWSRASELIAKHPGLPTEQGRLIWARRAVAGRLLRQRRFQEAEQACRERLRLYQTLREQRPDPNLDTELALAHEALAGILKAVGRDQEAEKACRQAIVEYERAIANKQWLHAELATCHRVLGEVLRKLGRLAEAEAAFRQTVALGQKLHSELPTHRLAWGQQTLPEGHLDLGTFLQNTGRSDEALEHFAKAIDGFSRLIDLDSTNKDAWFHRGVSHARLKQQDKAVADFSKALELAPRSYPSWLNRGIAYGNLKKWPEAIADYSKAIELDPCDFRAWNNRGNVYRQVGKQLEAISDFSKAIALKPTEVLPRRNRADAYFDLGKWAEAAVDYSKLLELAPEDAISWNRRGGCYRQLKDYDKALADLSKVVDLKPDLGLKNRSVLYFDLGKWPEAIADSSKLLELTPEDASAWNHRGAAYGRLGELDKAIADFSKALDLKPDFALPRINRAALRFKLGKWAEAAADYSKLIDSESEPEQRPAFHLNRARAYTRLGRFKEGRDDYRKVLELVPQAPMVSNDLAWLLATSPDPKVREPGEAVKLAKKAVELAPKEGNFWNTLGAAHYSAGDWKAAVETLEKSTVLRKGGDSFDWFLLAMAHWRLGKQDEARKWYDRAVGWMEKNQPENEELRRFRREAEDLLKIEPKKQPENEEPGGRPPGA